MPLQDPDGRRFHDSSAVGFVLVVDGGVVMVVADVVIVVIMTFASQWCKY